MDDLKRIERRMVNFRSVQEVVSSMRALSLVLYGQATDALFKIRAYEEDLISALGLLPTLSFSSIKPEDTLSIVFGSGQGLVGAFTRRVVDGARLAPSKIVYAVGHRTRMELLRQGISVAAWHPASSSVRGLETLIGDIAQWVEPKILGGTVTSVSAVYPKHEAPGHYRVQRIQLFPPDPSVFEPSASRRVVEPRSYEDLRSIAQKLLEEQLYVGLYRTALEALASEQGTRLKTTDAATHAIERRLEELQSEHHRARQTEITSEVQEVIASAEMALKEGAMGLDGNAHECAI